MVFETELEREIELEKEKQKKKEEKRKRKSYNGKKVVSCIIGIIVFMVVAFFSYQYYKDWNLNQEIIKNNNQKIELAQIEKMKLWNETIENIKENNKYIEVNYDKYKVKLDSGKLENNNEFSIQVSSQKSNYQEWKNQEILEIDVSKIQPSNILEQIELNTNELLKGLNKVDIYGIKAEDKKIEYIETKEIHEDNITLILREEYEKYVLVYVPVEEIKVEEEEIEIFKDELYQMQLRIEPSNATTKMIHIEDLEEGNIIQVKENGVIQAVEVGTTEFKIEAEQGKVKKKVKVTVKEKAEEAPTESEKEQLVEKENETTTDMLQIQNDEEQVNATILDNYINGILIVNKAHSLPNNYDPGTNPEALQAFENMKAKANEEGISLKIVSGYRSYQTQQSIYQRNVKLYGEESASTFSAKPRTIGTSNRACF